LGSEKASSFLFRVAGLRTLTKAWFSVVVRMTMFSDSWVFKASMDAQLGSTKQGFLTWACRPIPLMALY